MDTLNLQPEEQVAITDSTSKIEGQQDHVEAIERAYPEEDFSTPVEKGEAIEQKEKQQPQQPQQQQPQVQDQVAEELLTQLGIGGRQQQPQQITQQQQPQQTTQQATQQPKKPTKFTWQYDENGDIPVEQIQAAFGGKVPEGVIRKLSLTKDYIEKEEILKELFDDGWNLEKQLQAFIMIRDDEELAARYDHNEDGEITYDDFFDTTNIPGFSKEMDQQLTQEWLAGLQSKDIGSRARAIWQQNGAGQNMARYINLRRRHALSDKDEGDDDWGGLVNENFTEGIRQNAAGGLFDLAGTGLEIVGRFENAINGKSFWEDSDLDERVLQSANENSLEYLVNHNLARSALDTIAYEGAFWAVPTMLTGGALGAAGKGIAASGLPGAIRVGQFLQPAMTGGKVIPYLKGGKLASKTVRPGTHLIGKTFAGKTSNWLQVKTAQTFNMTASVGKSILIADMPIAAFVPMEESGRGMMYEDGLIKKFMDADVNGHFYVSPTAQGYTSPFLKRADFMLTEGVLGTLGTVVLGGAGRSIFRRGGQIIGSLPSVPGKVSRLSNEALQTMSASTRNWSLKAEGPIADASYWFKQTQTQLKDLAEAAVEGSKKSLEGPRNAFNNAVQSDGALKNAYSAYTHGAKLLGQTYSKARDGIRQVINDIDEIWHTVGTSNRGSTNSLFSQTDLAKGAKAGLDENKIGKMVEDLVNDPEYKRQLSAKSRRGDVSDTSLDGIKEAILGRNAGNTSPAEFWGNLLDEPLDVSDFSKLDDFKKWSIRNIEVQDAVNRSLLLQLRDMAASASDMIGKTDIFATDGAMQRIGDNLIAGIHQLKKTQVTWELARKMLKESDGKMTPEKLIELNAEVARVSSKLHQQTRNNVNTMVNMLMERGDDELAGAVLDVFKVAGEDIHGWRDFDSWMHQAIVGGKFKGKVKTGDLVHGLQKVMIQSILSGPKTPMRAMLGTTLNSYLNVFNEALGATITRPFTGDIRGQKIALSKLKGQLEVIPEAFKVMMKEWNSNFKADIADIQTRYTEATPDDSLWEAKRIHVETQGTDAEKAAFYINNTARNLTNNKLFSWSPRALSAIDATHKFIMARARSKELALRQVLEETGDDWTKITPEILKKAEDIHYSHFLDGEGKLDFSGDSFLDKQFKEVTLTSELKGTAQQLDKVFSNIPLIKPFYLFARTGINGLNFTYKNTPLLGALHEESIAILKHTGDDFTELAEYGIKDAADLRNARNLFAGRQATGAAVVTTMAGMYMAGQLTGNGPADRKLKQSWINAGWKPNHFYIGDVGFDYTTLEPFNIIFSTIADIGDNMELMGSEWSGQRLQAASFVIGRGLTGKTYMAGLDQLMQIVQMKPGAMDKAVANILNNSIHLAGMRNEFGKWINPHMKEINSDMWSSIRNRNKALEFTAKEALPNKHDILNGKPINNWNIIGRSFNAVSPIQIDIRNDTPGRRLLLNSNYDLKSTIYSYGGYSFTKHPVVRSHFQNEIGSVPIEFRNRKFKNLEEAMNFLSTNDDIKISIKRMQADSKNPANWDMDPNNYPHNTIIDNLFEQARNKAWAKLNQKGHPVERALNKAKFEKDGLDSKTRGTRQDILDLSFPQEKTNMFPK